MVMSNALVTLNVRKLKVMLNVKEILFINDIKNPYSNSLLEYGFSILHILG